MDIRQFWDVTLRQDADRMRPFFSSSAHINWHCTNERFTVEEYIRANCEYPGEWTGAVERIEQAGNTLITAVRVHPADRAQSFHVVSFFTLVIDKIAALDEYWSDDGPAPQWRQAMKIGTQIKNL